MWCQQCRQDVPAIASLGAGKFHCARCGGEVGNRFASDPEALRDVSAAGIDLSAGPARRAAQRMASPEAPTRFDDWESDERLSELRRLLPRSAGSQQPAGLRGEPWRYDAPHAVPHPPQTIVHPRHAAAQPRHTTARAKAPAARPSALAWMALALGLMTFVCGGVLLAWSFFSARADLWSLGMPITLAGQCVLVFGLVLQLDRIWQAGREQNDRLRHVDRRLSDLRREAALLGTPQASSAQSFYSHMAQGASPQLLLADLKGQIDLLALRMAREA